MVACCMIRAFCRPLQKLAQRRGGFRVGLPYRHHGIFIIDQRVRIIASRENQAQPLVRRGVRGSSTDAPASMVSAVRNPREEKTYGSAALELPNRLAIRLRLLRP